MVANSASPIASGHIGVAADALNVDNVIAVGPVVANVHAPNSVMPEICAQ